MSMRYETRRIIMVSNRERRAAVSVACLGILAVGAAVNAEWSDDPAVNLPIADVAGDQVQPKIGPTSDGGCYISWFDNRSGGYDVYLQRLDAAGDEQWVHNGMLIADRSFGSTQDYDLAVDAEDNALLAFRDDRFGGVVATAQKIAPDGATPWGANGVQLGDSSAFIAAPKITTTDDGFVIVGWTQDSDSILQKLDADGVPQWGEGVIATDPDGRNLSVSDLESSANGSVIASFVRSGDLFDPRHLVAQRYDADGFEVWNVEAHSSRGGVPFTVVFDGGSLQIGNFPGFVTDGLGGAVFAWYSVSPLQVRAQRIAQTGDEVFPHNGIEVSTNASRIRVEPDVDFAPDTLETFIFWREQNSTQSQTGVYGQKLDADGARQWTDNGREIVPVGTDNRTQVRTLAIGGGAMVYYVESTGFDQDRLYGARVDGDGAFVWDPNIIDVSSIVSGKSRLAAALSADDVALLAWSDRRNDGGDLFAQNVNGDGSLGVSEVFGDLNGDGTVNVLDLLLLLAEWGTDDPGADLDGNGIVNVLDLLMLLDSWS
jgi:hypothetical protein